MALYRSFGLSIDSPVPLGLPPAEGTGSVLVHFGRVSSPSSDERPGGDGCWSATSARALYFWPEVGAFEVLEGSTITMEPAPDTDDDTLRLTLLGPLLATVLHQRGYLVLHASGLGGQGGAIAVCAHSGTGKSTTAALLADQGYTLLTDDLLVVDLDHAEPRILPGGAGIKLWDASVAALGREPTELNTIGARYSKRALSHQPSEKARPLRALYVLTKGHAQKPRVIPRPRAVVEVMSRSYCSELLRFTDGTRNLSQASALVRQVPVYHLERGESFDEFDDWSADLLTSVHDRVGDPD